MKNPSTSFISCYIRLEDVSRVGETGYEFTALPLPDSEFTLQVLLSTTAHDVRFKKALGGPHPALDVTVLYPPSKGGE
jgi:hypothetical protein